MKFLGKGVGESAEDLLSTWAVLIDVVFGVQHLLCLSNRNADCNPIPGFGAFSLGGIDPVESEPFFNGGSRFGVGGQETFNFFFR